MIDLKALQKQVALLEADLKPTGLASDRLKVEWRAAKSADRTAATFETWLGERVTQVAVAWVLATVFVRFCEDNGLIEYPYIAGPGDRVQLAADLQQKYYEDHPESDDRGWLEAAFKALSVSPVAAGPLRPQAQPDVDDPPVPARGEGAARLLAADRRGRPDPLRPDRPGVEHPFPRRPLPVPVRGRAEDLRAAPDARVRRGVHPQLHPRPGDRGVRP